MKLLRENRRTIGFCMISFMSMGLFGSGPCLAQYRVISGHLDADGLPTSSAQVCVGTKEALSCYPPPSKEYAFGLDPKIEVVGKLGGVDLILFTSTFSGGGSGTLTNFALLVARSGALENLLPPLQLTNQSEWKIWSIPGLTVTPTLVVADFVWDFGEHETHFSSHRY